MQHRIEATIGPGGMVVLDKLPFREGEAVEIVVSTRQPKTVHGLRPFGLCAGEFVVPDDFDAPLPEEVLQDFEGR
jgi:hypothetical protein